MKNFLNVLNKNYQLRYWFTFSLILLLAAWLRLYKLGEVPHGMTWDEAAIGYNGYSIMTTRRDEWLQKLPTSFKSFGDYKAPLAIYLNGPFTALWGMNLWAVRLPFALAGIFSIAGMILLTTQIFQQLSQKENSFFSAKTTGLFAGLILTLSPWHLHYSRAGFESGLALCCFLWGAYFFLKCWSETRLKWQILWISSASLLSVASLYAYHSSKIAVPLMIFVLTVFFTKQIKLKTKPLLTGGLVAVVALWPLIKDILFGHSLERGQTLIIYTVTSWSEGLLMVIQQFLAHFSFQFLFMGATPTLRLGEGHWGVLFITTGILIGCSIWFFLKSCFDHHPYSRVFLLGLSWIGIGILPAALGSDIVPHANRALLALPGFLLLAMLGFNQLLSWASSLDLNKRITGTHHEKNKLVQMIIGMFLLIHALVFLSYLQDYYTFFARESATDFEDGYLEAFHYILPYEKGEEGKPVVDKIIFSDAYGQPYIYALFARKTNPIWYQGGSLIKYEFRPVKESDFSRHNTILVASNQEDVPTEQADYLVYGSDHQVKFSIFVLP